MSSAVPGRVLVVDDEFQLMDALVEALTTEGYEVHGVLSGVEAVEALQTREFDLLLTDLMMPGMDGISLLRACMAIAPNLVGILMTGQGTVSTAVEAMKVGAFDYILKPFRLDVLLPVLARAREMQRLRLENIQLRETVAIHNLSQTIALSRELSIVLEKTADAALQQMDADEVSIMLLKPESEELAVAAIRGAGREHLLGRQVSLQDGIAGWVARQAEPLLLNGAVSDPRFAPVYPRPGIHSAISLPMMTAGKLVGVLNVNSLQPRRPFTQGQVKALSILTASAAAALESESLFHALEASEKRFRSLIEHAPDGIALLGMDGKLQHLTPSTQHILGYLPEAMVGQDPVLFIHRDDLPSLLNLLQDLMQNPGKVARTEYRFLHQDGSWRWLDSTISNLIVEPSVQSIVFNYRDVTDQKAAAEALRDSEERYRLATQAANDVIWEWNSKTSKLTWSENAPLVFGYSPEEVGPDNWWDDHIHPDDRQRVVSQMAAITAGDQSTWSSEYRFLLKDGSYAYVSDHGYVERDASGSPTRMLGAMANVTQRKQAEEALRKSETRFRSLIENSSDEVSIVSADGSLLYESPSSNPTLGYQAGEFLGKNLFDLVHPEDLERVLNRLKEILQDPTFHPREQFRLLHRSGAWRWVEAVGTNLLQEPSVGGIVINYHDVTERVQAEDALRKSQIRFRNLFENTPVSIWEEDFSELKTFLDTLTEQGVTDLKSYFDEHPEVVTTCLGLVKLLDVNQASLKLHEAATKDALLANLQDTFVPEAFDTFKREMLAIARGEQQIELDVTVQTLTGQRREATMNWAVVPGEEESYARVLVSLVDITERKRAEERIRRQLQRLRALRAIDLAITSTFDMNISLSVLLHGTVLQLEVSAAAVLLFNQPMLTLEYAAGSGFRSTAIQQTRLRLGEGLGGRAALEKEAVQVPDLAQIGDAFVRKALLQEEGFVSYYGVPLVAKGELKGVLEIFHRAELHPDQEWLDFLETLAGQAAIAIDNGQLFEDLRRSNLDLALAYDATIEGWSRAMDLRDRETEGHTQRVTELTLRLAKAFRMKESELVHLRRGALLHDMGKLGVPDNILLKSGKLTDAEWEIMRKHPQFAYDMLSSIHYLKPALNIPYCHHEKWDGTGYPRGLKGKRIPLEARLFAVVDVWDAVTSDRPYRTAWSREEALQYIKDQFGKHFDPDVVKVFIEMLTEHEHGNTSVRM